MVINNDVSLVFSIINTNCTYNNIKGQVCSYIY